jgi:hypothetical protein
MGERDDDGAVTMRDIHHLERLIAEIEKRRDDLRKADHALFALQLGARDTALTLETGRIDKRLSDLNGEADRLLKATSETVSADTWAGHTKSYETWKLETVRKLDAGVTKENFDTYQRTVIEDLARRAGQAQAFGRIAATLAALASFVSLYSVFDK